MNVKKIDEILALDDMVRYVGIIDLQGNIITSKIKNSREITYDNNEFFWADLCIVKKILDVADDSFGKTVSIQTIREKLCQLIYYCDNMIVYVTCNPDVNDKKMLEISNRTGQLVKELVSTDEKY